MIRVLATTALFLLLLAELPPQAQCSTEEGREMIVRALLSRANNLVRPDERGQSGSPLVVQLNYSLTRVLEVDEVNNYMKMTGYLALSWNDSRMAYPLALRGHAHNISLVRLDASQVWTPDIELYNTFSPSLKTLNRKDLVMIEPTGKMVWVPQVAFDSFCVRSQSSADTIHCALFLGSWTYSASDLDLQVPEEADLSAYYPTGQWRVDTARVTRLESVYQCCPDLYISALYSFTLKRQ